MHRSVLGSALGSAFALAASVAVAAPLDLSGFTRYGAGNGNWAIAGDKLSVTQTTNTSEPTAFVSADGFVNSSFEGSFEVRTTSDDDYIGFVFGFGADDSTPFFLFDWKQLDQSGSADGFTLARVTGGLSAIPFGNHQSDATGYDVIATDVDTSTADPRGWADNTEYGFKLTYLTNRIIIEVAGTDRSGGALGTIFDVTPDDVAGVSSFAAGRFGFYNYSQSNVRYAGFTETAVPPQVPLPAALPLAAAGFGLLLAMARRRAA